DPASALECLARAGRGPIVRGTVRGIEKTNGGVRVTVEEGSIDAGAVVLCAGAGNEALLEMVGEHGAVQRRPLHMVFARRAGEKLFGHWVAAVSDKPRLTVTSDGDVWYLGGELAESGVDRSESEQIEFAKRELAACFPDLQVGGWRFGTLRIDRAEG